LTAQLAACTKLIYIAIFNIDQETVLTTCETNKEF